MALDSPVVILYDAAGNPLAVQNGVVTPASTPGLHILGSDGTTSRYIAIDSAGRTVSVGAGTPGAPAGGVLSVQGVVGGQVLPVAGADVGVNGAAIPSSSSLTGFSDGTNLQPGRVFDLDSGVGTEYNQGISIRLPGAGGSTAGGTAATPIRIDPTGTTTQPISAAALPLPTGAATETTLAGVLTTTAFQARVNTLGQKTMANSTPVVIASDQSAIPVSLPFPATATRSNVASSATSVTILASNANRKGAIIYNDSTKLLYLKFGTTASVTDFTTLLRAGDQYEVPFGYTGIIDGIWNVANGAARVTELT